MKNLYIRKIQVLIAGIILIIPVFVYVFTSDVINKIEIPERFYHTIESESILPQKPINSFIPLITDAKIKNPDTIGWLKISGTEINNPILQTKNNDYYLKKNFEGKASSYGVLFADFRNVFTEKSFPKNTVIYGHNLGYGRTGMFGQLEKFKNFDFVKNNQHIYFSLDGQWCVWRVFATYITDTDFYYIEPEPNEKLFKELIDGAKQRSKFIFNVDVLPEDRILTLSTCTYEFGYPTNTRFVVMAKLLKFGEKDTTKIIVTPNPTPLKPNVKKGVNN